MVNLKILIATALGFSMLLIGVSFYTLSVSGERNVLQQIVETKESEIKREKDNVAFMKAWMERDKLDALKKEVEFNRTMAAKPVFKTKIEYVPTGDNCTDLNAIAEEARKNAEGSKL